MVGRLLAVFLLATAGLISARPVVAAGDTDRLFVTAQPRDQADVDRIWRLSEHVLGPHDPQPVAHTLIVSRAALESLRGQGVPVTVRPVDVATLLADLQTAAQASIRPSAAPISVGQLGIFGGWFNQVQDLAAIYAHLDELAGASNGRARVIVVGKSIEGREIRGLQIDARDPGRASMLITGTLHAREWAAPMVTMGFANALVRQYAFDRDVRTIATTVAITIVPVVNVDGYVASHNGRRLQRKNMNPRCGVDLNRNFDVQFGAGAMPAACDQENYPGAAAFSEPESRAIKQLAESLPNLRLFLDYHAPSEQVMVPYAYTRTRPPDYQRSLARAQLYATTLAKLYGTLHPAREGYDLAQGQGGGAIDWFRLNHCESFAIELRDGRELAGFELPAAQIIPAVEENWLAWRALALQIAQDNGAPVGEIGDLGTTTPPTPAGSVADESRRAAGCAMAATAPASATTGFTTLALLVLTVRLSRLRPRRRVPAEPPRVPARGTACADRCPGVRRPSSCCRRLRPG